MPLSMRCRKLKGFNNPFRVEYQAVNLDTLPGLGPRHHRPEALHAKALNAQGGPREGARHAARSTARSP